MTTTMNGVTAPAPAEVVGASRTTGDDHHGDSGSAGPAAWVPVVKIIVGVCIVLAGLWWSWQRFAGLGHGEYVYTMFGYMLVMMLGGGLLANGVITIVKQLRDNIGSIGARSSEAYTAGDGAR